jgi:hypothetical protein
MRSYAGLEDFRAWRSELEQSSFQIYKKGESDCEISQSNIIKFTEDFNIGEQDFKRIFFNSKDYYFYDYAPSVIYSEDYKIVNEYYISGGSRADDIARRKADWLFRSSLISDFMGWSLTGEEHYSFARAYDKHNHFNWLEENAGIAWEDISYALWSLADFVRDLNIAREDFAEFYYSFRSGNPSSYEYDIEKIYNFDIERYDAEALNKDGRGWRIDTLLRYNKYSDEFEYARTGESAEKD